MNTKEIRSKRGRSARARGKRVEYGLRDYLRKLGWTAHRVPLSGSAQGFKGDVIAEKEGRTVTFESKAHSGKFDTIFTMVEDYLSRNDTGIFSVYLPAPHHKACDVAFDLTQLLDYPKSGLVYELPENLSLDFKKYKRTLNRLPKLIELVDSSDILVLYENRKPFLFVRFR